MSKQVMPEEIQNKMFDLRLVKLELDALKKQEKELKNDLQNYANLQEVSVLLLSGAGKFSLSSATTVTITDANGEYLYNTLSAIGRDPFEVIGYKSKGAKVVRELLAIEPELHNRFKFNISIKKKFEPSI